MDEHPQRHQRIIGIPDQTLEQAIIDVAGSYNDDLQNRAIEVIAEGKDALQLIAGAFAGAGKQAIEEARRRAEIISGNTNSKLY